MRLVLILRIKKWFKKRSSFSYLGAEPLCMIVTNAFSQICFKVMWSNYYIIGAKVKF